jgi:hypothetical protein
LPGATPVIVDGVVYVQDLDSDVLAISLATGNRSAVVEPDADRQRP